MERSTREENYGSGSCYFLDLLPMSNPRIRDCNHYIIMEPCKDEQFLTAKETLQWLETWLNKMEELPEDVKNQPSKQASAQRLLDTSCDLEVKPGFKLQWFAVRLEK